MCLIIMNAVHPTRTFVHVYVLHTARIHNCRSIVENKGSWGVSIAGVPTATRPGHVAMIAGFFEYPTSITKGT